MTRYQLRANGRPTPFGLLAGVTRADLGTDAKVRIGTAHQRFVHADAGWSHELICQLLREPARRQRARVVISNLVEVRGDRLVLPYLRGGGGRALSIANGPAVQVVLSAARSAISYAELHALLLRDVPEATAQHVDALLGGLIDREILLTDLAGLSVGELAERFDDERLREIDRLLAAYAARGGVGPFRRAVDAMRELVPSERPPVQVDLRMDADVVLPAAIADETARVAEVLWRLAPHGEALPNLKAFHQEFLERYGVDRTVPVQQLLDPHLGLGAPSEYRQPPTERNKIPTPGNPYPAWRDELLGDWITNLDGWELVLDDAMVDQLAGASDDAPPDSLDLCVQVVAESPDAAERGEYTLVCGGGAGAVSAGAMSGRFAEMLGLTAELQELLADDAGPVPLQLEFLPAEPRFGNVVRVPRLLRGLSVGTFAEDSVGIDRVRAGSTGDRFYLVAEGIEREITVVRPHMINMATAAPNAARFVAGVALAGRRLWTPWQWGRLDALARLPRVRYGRTVLAPARWRVPRDVDFDRWRVRHDVPDVVRIGAGDNYLELDLRSPLHRRILDEELKQTRIITESPVRYGGFGITAGHANELVVPLRACTPRPAVPRTRAWQTTAGKRHRPGGEWVSAKIYAQPDSHDGLLVKQVDALLRRLPASVDRWFFLRYKDPDAHLRLRFHGADVLPVLNEWADENPGALRSLVIDEYEPEVARYGGPAAMVPAERLFQADSAAVIGQLQHRLDVPIEALVAANQADLLASLGDWDWQHWVLNAFPIKLSNDVPAADRRAALPIIDEPPRQLVPLWTPRRAAAREYGALIGIGTNDVQHQAVGAVLHLHANRLLGTDRLAEQRAYGLLRAAVRRQIGRREHR